MSAHPPPVPPDQRPTRGATPERASVTDDVNRGSVNDNLHEQGEKANVDQNTTNRGHHQGNG